MSTFQRRVDLNRLLHYRRKHGIDIGPELGWIEVIANYVKVRDRTVTAEIVRKEAKSIGLPSLDRSLVDQAVEIISAQAWGSSFPLFKPRIAGIKLQVTSVERDAAEVLMIEAIDESAVQRRKRKERERRAVKRALEAAPKRPTKKALADALGVSRPTLDKWIEAGKVDPETGEIKGFTNSVRKSPYYVSDMRTQNVKSAAGGAA